MIEENFENEARKILESESEKEAKSSTEIIDKEFISLFWDFVFGKLSDVYNNEKFKLTKEENEFLTNATTRWLNYRLPLWIQKNSIDFEFLFAIVSVLSTKLILIKSSGIQNNNNFGKNGTGENNISKTDN